MMESGPMAAAAFSLLDLRINKFSDRDVVRLVADVVQTGQHSIIANQNLHSVYIFVVPRVQNARFLRIGGLYPH